LQEPYWEEIGQPSFQNIVVYDGVISAEPAIAVSVTTQGLIEQNKNDGFWENDLLYVVIVLVVLLVVVLVIGVVIMTTRAYPRYAIVLDSPKIHPNYQQ